MIRDAHDFRAGIHDRQLRKLTGRSYSALVHPVVARLPDRDDARGRRLLPQRRLPLRGRHRPPARPLRHRAGVPRRARSSRSCRRSATTTTSAAPCRARCPAHATQRLRGGPDGPADQAVGRGRAQRGGADDHDPQLPDARLAGRRPRRRVLGLPDGRAAARRAVRRGTARDAVEACFDAILDQHHRDLPPRDPGQDPGRHLRLGGLRRARRRRRAAAAHPADHADPHRRRRPGRRAAGPRLRPAPARRPRARSTTAATTPTASSSRSGWRRSCATSPTPPSGWPSSTSTRASCR